MGNFFFLMLHLQGSNIGVLQATGPDTCHEECVNMGENLPNGPICGSYTFYANETLCILWTEYCGDTAYCTEVEANNPSDDVSRLRGAFS